MIDPTCWPRSAPVRRPGTSPFTSCTRSMWRAVAMTSRSVRSNGSVPLSFRELGGARFAEQLRLLPVGSLGIGGVDPIHVLDDREASRSERVGDQKRAGVGAVRRDARGRELVVMIGREGAADDRAGRHEMNGELI